MILIKTLILLALAWNIVGFILFGFIFLNEAVFISDMLTPKGVYSIFHVNWFGAIVLIIVFNLMCPILSIGWWFYWLCTVGRK